MGEVLVLFNPPWARMLAEQGYTREAVQQRLWERARRRLGDFKVDDAGEPAVAEADHYHWWPDWVDQSDPDTLVPVANDPGSIHVVVTGADSLIYGAVCPSWGALGGFAVTRALPERRPTTPTRG
jgi:hypothetical protein